MTQIAYRLWREYGLWHWEVAAEGARLSHGACADQVHARVEAFLFATGPEAAEAMSRRSGERACKQQDIRWFSAGPEWRIRRASDDFPYFEESKVRQQELVDSSKRAVSESRKLLSQFESPAFVSRYFDW